MDVHGEIEEGGFLYFIYKIYFFKKYRWIHKEIRWINISYFKSLINNLFIIEYWTCKNMYALYRKDKLCL